MLFKRFTDLLSSLSDIVKRIAKIRYLHHIERFPFYYVQFEISFPYRCKIVLSILWMVVLFIQYHYENINS